MSASDPQLVGPYEQLHRKLDSLQMRLIRDLSKNPWRTQDLIFEPWDELHDPKYDLEWELHTPFETLLGMLQSRNLHLFSPTQTMEVIRDGNESADQGQH